MGMPEIPNIKPDIQLDIEDVIKVLLLSVALEELSLAHILNAEGMKIQEIIEDNERRCNKLQDLLEIDQSVQRTLRDIIKKEILLEFKFENIMDLIDKTSS